MFYGSNREGNSACIRTAFSPSESVPAENLMTPDAAHLTDEGTV